jgi:hypothetical protein
MSGFSKPMNAEVPGPSNGSPGLPPRLNAVIEILGLYCSIAVTALCFILGWLTPNGAAAVTAILLCTVLALSWIHFDQGRHPCFLFMGILTLVQGGRLLAYCIGAEHDPLRIRNVVMHPFDVSRDVGGIALLCVALSGVSIYAPCRWNYRRIRPPSDEAVRRYLPYLYLLFYSSLPFQVFKNYTYYNIAREHGGYLYFFANHAAFTSSVPFFVRLIALITPPVFVAIFVFDRRNKRVHAITIIYFASSVLILLLGSRIGTFGLLLTLWYVAGIKSGQKSRIARVALFGVALLLGADLFQALREDPRALSDYTFAPIEFVKLQGNSLDVTEIVVRSKNVFSRYGASYLWNELQDAFVPRDATGYSRGTRLSDDVSVYLNSKAFAKGFGTAGSYIAEAYLVGDLAGVFIISLLIGCGLHFLHRFSGNAGSLFIVAMLLPDVIAMPRGQLLDWMSVLLRSTLFIGILLFGWLIYDFVIWLKAGPRQVTQAGTADGGRCLNESTPGA